MRVARTGKNFEYGCKTAKSSVTWPESKNKTPQIRET